MKLYGIGGVGTGKLGNQIFAVKAGTQIVRQYQPVVANPNTAAQVKTRAKLKLMSQVAAIVAPAIAIPAEGLRTRRNNFISQNYGLIQYTSDEASVYLNSLQLTKSNIYFPKPTLTVAQGQVTATLTAEPEANISKVVFVFIAQGVSNNIRLLKTIAVNHEAGVTPSTSFMHIEDEGNIISCLAYGIRPNSEDASMKLSNMIAELDAPVVKLLAERNLLASDVTFTATSGAYEEV